MCNIVALLAGWAEPSTSVGQMHLVGQIRHAVWARWGLIQPYEGGQGAAWPSFSHTREGVLVQLRPGPMGERGDKAQPHVGGGEGMACCDLPVQGEGCGACIQSVHVEGRVGSPALTSACEV